MPQNNQEVGPIEGYRHISKVVRSTVDMMDKVRSGALRPLFTSLSKEREKIGGFYPSDQIVIAGRTGCGKSAKVAHDILDYCNVELNPYYANKLIILWDSYEMADWRNVLRLISREAGVEAKSLLDYHQRLTEERYLFLKTIAKKFVNLPIYISTKPLNASDWVESKKQIQGKYPGHTIVNVFDHTRLGRKKDESKEEELIHRFMIGGIELKNNFNQINFWLSQMNRNIETAISRDKLGTHLPVSSDIFGSDSVFQCADVVYALHRPGMYGLTDFEGVPTGISKSNPDTPDDLLLEVILKQREGWTGYLKLRHNLAINHVEDYKDTLMLPSQIESKISKVEDDF